MDVVKNLWNSMKSGWNGLSQAKRIGLVSVSALTVIISLVVYINSQTVEYALLFSGMEEADSGAIVNDLDAKGIAYRLEDNGTSIRIDKDYVDKYRIELAVNDMLPSNSIGFEIFDTSGMMDTDKDRDIKKQRAIQGELERAISALGGIDSAKVILSIPEDSVFTRPDDLEESSASIMIVKSGSLSTSAIQGIAALVSGAVDNLPIGNVSIVDENGALLSAFLQENGTSLFASDEASRNREIEKNYARELEQKVLTTLAPIYGLENLSVSVNVRMNFDVGEEELVLYGQEAVDTDEAVDSKVRSEIVTASGGEINTEEVNGNDLAVNEVVEGENGNTASFNSTRNYELDQRTTRTIFETGRVEEISASVLFNAGIPGLADDNQLQAVVTNILGSDAEGNIEVIRANFNTPNDDSDPAVIAPAQSLEEFWMNNRFFIIIGFVSILLIVIIILVVIARIRNKQEEEAINLQMEEEKQVEAKNVELKTKNILKEKLRNEQLEKESSAYQEAKDNPEVVADLIKMWMKDE